MANPLDDIRIDSIQQLIAPTILKEQIPVSEEARNTVTKVREEAEAILRGSDNRVLAIVGPCSIHDTEAALEYADRLAAINEKVKDDLLLVMRVYFEKPRTTIGWKGLINDPDLDQSYHINRGLTTASSTPRRN